MAQEKKGLVQRCKDWTAKNRNWILYAAGVITLMGVAAGWALLPDQVALQAAAEGQTVTLVNKTTALGGTAALVAVFAALFAWKPRELVYFVALCLGCFWSAPC